MNHSSLPSRITCTVLSTITDGTAQSPPTDSLHTGDSNTQTDQAKLVTDGGFQTSHMDIEPPLIAVDLFAGAGGFSQGLSQACAELGLELAEAAINHDQDAIDTHRAAHPDSHQYHSKVQQLHPPDVVRQLGNTDTIDVDLLTAGPECTHFSHARGGKPVTEQKRMSPWHILAWLSKLNVSQFIIENVKEIMSWGPVKDGTPSRDGSIFDAWINALNQLGYAVDWTTLTASDFGDPTSRERFFLIGSKHGQVTFPDPTHSDEDDTLPDKRTAADIIDWSNLGGSIWTRDLHDGRVTPPKQSTLQRIGDGIRRHCGDSLSLFAPVVENLTRDDISHLRTNRVVPLQYASIVASLVDDPFLVPAPTAIPAHTLLLRQQDGAHPISVTERPVPTIATGGAHALVTPALCPVSHQTVGRSGAPQRSTLLADSQPTHPFNSDPCDTAVTPLFSHLLNQSWQPPTTGLTSSSPTEGTGPRVPSLPALQSLFPTQSTRPPHTNTGAHSLPTPINSRCGASFPLLRQPFIEDCQSRAGQSLDNPLKTVPASDRFALCVPELWPWGLDIRYRLLQPRELKQAQGFPADYPVSGTKTSQKTQIGNAVPVRLAKTLCTHVLTTHSPSLASYGGGITPDTPTTDTVPEYPGNTSSNS